MVENLLGGPAPTLLPEDTEPVLALASGQDPDLVAREHPSSSLAWAVVSDLAWPALLATGIALRMAAAGEPLPGPQGKLMARWWRSSRG